MKIENKPLLVAVFLLLGASLAFSQNGDGASARPTSNDVRLRVTIDSGAAGSQSLVIEAMNSSGEVVDRKEIRFHGVARGQSFFVALSQPDLPPRQSVPDRLASNVSR